MNIAPEVKLDTEHARQIWKQYEKSHDLSALIGKVAAIDPVTEQVWIGEWFDEAADLAKASGIDRPLCFTPIGQEPHRRKRR